jgi:uncharacterized protein YcbK (DUF882 family)
MKKIFNALFIGDDGRVSWTAVGMFFGYWLIITWYVSYFFLGWKYESDTLTFMEVLLASLVGGRVIQRGVYYGTNALEEIQMGSTRRESKEVRKQTEVVKQQTTKQRPRPQLGGVNFKIEEFESKDGARMSATVKANIMMLMGYMEIIREACGNRPITITSGYRSAKHNAAVGGSKGSLHTKGMAADFKVRGLTPTKVHAIVERLIEHGKLPAGGLGLYKTWVHYDFRNTNVRWKG